MVTSTLYTENGLTAEGFKFYAKKAWRMTTPQLWFALKDCQECIRKGINPLRYSDESSCYNCELIRRKEKS